MPISYRFDRSLRALFAKAQGVVTNQELLDYAARATTDPEIEPGCCELIDFVEAEVGAVSSAALRRVAEIFHSAERMPSQSRIAIVAASDVSFGLSRMYEAYRDRSPIVIRVFRERGQARVWLGLPRDLASESSQPST